MKSNNNNPNICWSLSLNAISFEVLIHSRKPLDRQSEDINSHEIEILTYSCDFVKKKSYKLECLFYTILK